MQISGILIPHTDAPTIATVNSLGASTAISIGSGKKFSITAIDSTLAACPFQVAYGTSSVTATSSSDIFPPGKYTMGTATWTHISIYNPTSGAITICVTKLANT